MGKPKAPTPPDPNVTAGAQTAQNVSTALTNATLGNVNQVTPDGSLTYSVSGYTPVTDPNTGTVYKIPQYTATTALSENGQKIQDINNTTNLNLAQIGADQSAKIGSILGTPVDLSNDAVEARLMELGRSRLDPALASRKQALESQLSQQGIKLGSKAYEEAMKQNMQGENDAYNQLLLNGRGQAVTEALTQRNQPINEITALMNGSQVSMPNFINPNTTSVPNTDVAGLINDNYNQKLNAWNQRMQGISSTMGGLFGLGAGILSAPAGSLAAGLFSDIRLKKNVTKIGQRPDGLGLYAYDYIWGGPRQVGVMAHEVEAVYPEAVMDVGGFKAVDYGRIC